ncbi:hypothetical protein DCAR_0418174 [Daucus carota subsp. sativus]|uniref:Uncharacterized protein n=1 Tax=Daucus carota subsp. sativus TaxID=79200 RepID=A0A165Z7J4_DAUCS|nr:hypothetical protein DCAR_0418174 [Daucus carota subsp. sativus]
MRLQIKYHTQSSLPALGFHLRFCQMEGNIRGWHCTVEISTIYNCKFATTSSTDIWDQNYLGGEDTFTIQKNVHLQFPRGNSDACKLLIWRINHCIHSNT